MARGTAHAPAETRREEILAAAVRCFAERGYHETTVDDVAARSKLSKGAIYWHFRGKREIFTALFDAYLQAMLALCERARGAQSAEEALRRMGQAPLASPEAVDLTGAILEYFAQASRDPQLRARLSRVYREFLDLIREQIERGVEEGILECDDPGAAAAGLIGAMDGIGLQLAFLDAPIDADRIWSATLEVWLRGLRK